MNDVETVNWGDMSLRLREAGLPELAIDDVEHLLDDLLGALNSHVIQTHPRRVLEAIAARCERAARVLRSEPIP